MPLNESTQVRRDRWPIAFDLEGVPRTTAAREAKLLEEKMNTHPVQNNFAVDYQAGNTTTDINNPPSPYRNLPGGRYIHQDYPKMLYPATWPAAKPKIVNSDTERDTLLAKGFTLKPPVRRDPSAEDLDAVEQEKEIVEATKPRRGRPPKVQPETAA